jgi:hypothetical protein
MLGEGSVSAQNDLGRRRCPGGGTESPLSTETRVSLLGVSIHSLAVISRFRTLASCPFLIFVYVCLGGYLIARVVWEGSSHTPFGPEILQPPVSTFSVRLDFLPMGLLSATSLLARAGNNHRIG